jgi:hypothetical protein
MNNQGYKILLIIALILSFQRLTIFAQSVQKDDFLKAKSIIDIDFSYSSNYGVYGIFNSFTSQPNTSPSIFYSGKNGLSLSASGFIFGNKNAPSVPKNSSELDLTGGWDFSLLNNSLTVSPSYSHFIYSSGNSKSMYSDQTELNLAGSIKGFRPNITANYLFGTKNALNLNLTLGYNLKIDNLFAQGNTLEFEPSFGGNYGDLSYADFIAKRLFQSLATLRKTYGDNITIQQLETNGALGNRKLPGSQFAILNPAATLGQIFAPATGYQINSWDITLPLSYTVKKLTLYSGLYISKPMNVPAYIKSQTVIYVSAGITYSFEL